MAPETVNPEPPKKERYQEKQILAGVRGFFSSLFASLPSTDILSIEQQTGKSWRQIEAEMMRDGDIKSTAQSRLAIVPGKSWELLPAEESAEANKIAETVKAILDQIPRFKFVLKHLLKAVFHGHSVVEPVWDKKNDLWVPVSLKLRRHSRFSLTEDGSQILVEDSTSLKKETVEDYKIVYHRNEPQDDAPFETPLLLTLFWPWYFKTNAWQFWMIVAEKWGVPSVVGKYPSHFTDADVLALLKALQNFQQDSVSAVPQDTTIDILKGEPGEKGAFFRELLEFCEKQISKAVLGGTLTQEVNQVGSYAASKTHMEVRQDIIEEDAQLLQDTLDATLVSWIVLFNFGQDAADRLCPGIKFNVTPGRDTKEFADTLSSLHAQGVRLPVQFYIDTFGLPPDTKLIEPSQKIQDTSLPFE